MRSHGGQANPLRAYFLSSILITPGGYYSRNISGNEKDRVRR
jgi:hypothetical protein